MVGAQPLPRGMARIIARYNGTIDEFIGDAILVVFGAPLAEATPKRARWPARSRCSRDDRDQRAERRRRPARSSRWASAFTAAKSWSATSARAARKYGIVGATINLTSRVESITVGGQVLISESTRLEVGRTLKIGQQIEVKAKGVEHPDHPLRGLRDRRKVQVAFGRDERRATSDLSEEFPLRYEVVVLMRSAVKATGEPSPVGPQMGLGRGSRLRCPLSAI